MKTQIMKMLALLVVASYLAACGDVTTVGNPTEEFTEAQAQEVVGLFQATFSSLSSVGESFGDDGSPDLSALTTSGTCSNGGSYSIDIPGSGPTVGGPAVTGTIEYDDCDFVTGSDTYTYDGTMTISQETPTADTTIVILTYDNFTITQNGATTFSMDGSVTLTSDSSAGTMTAEFDDFTGEFESDTYSIDGTITIDTVDETFSTTDLTFSSGSASATCNFTDQDANCVSCQDIVDACTLPTPSPCPSTC